MILNFQKRQTAYKFWIKDLLGAKKSFSKDFTNAFIILGKETLRINILGVVVQSYASLDGNYAFLTVDDSSGQIRMKAWGEDAALIKNFSVGNVVLAVGRMAEKNDEVFIRPEMAKQVDPKWATVRKLELSKSYGQPELAKSPKAAEETIDEDPIEPSIVAREKIVNLLEKTGEEGIIISELIKNSGLNDEEANQVIKELLEEGEAYQPKRGLIKLIV
ncbi:hypothetical protein HY643_00175 [Candidatus Woesearchaeota archaeon]|nr:hypothetical protein [Candidatus Woesearchaeota archaeon]